MRSSRRLTKDASKNNGYIWRESFSNDNPRMMHIGFISMEFPHPRVGSSGGIGTSIYNLAKGLIARGHKATVILYAQKEDAVFETEGIMVYMVKNVVVRGFSLYFSQKKVEALLNRLHAEGKMDIVEVPEWTGFSAFVQPKKCPVIIKLHGSDTYFCHLENRKVKFKNRFLEGRALRKADGILAVSDFTGRTTNTLFGLQRSYTVLHNGLDTQQFSRVPQAATTKTIVYIGTLIRKKGMMELPHIFNAIFQNDPEVKLVLVGTNALDISTQWKPTWDLMQPLFHPDAFQNVQYVGAVPYEAVQGYLDEVAVCVFPSFAEALPVSWIEAMAMGKAVVASNIGWAPEIITDGEDGFLADPRDHAAFAQRILSLLQNPEKALNMGKAAQEKVRQTFELDAIAAQHEAYYQAQIQAKK
jgi:glycosyltransferase involved in cell wall biosynthesis